MKKIYAKQRSLGLTLVILSIVATVLLDGDATVALLLIPSGLYAMFTKEKIIYDDVEKKDEEES